MQIKRPLDLLYFQSFLFEILLVEQRDRLAELLKNFSQETDRNPIHKNSQSIHQCFSFSFSNKNDIIESLKAGIKIQMRKNQNATSKKIQTHCDLFFEEESCPSQHQVY